MKSSAVTIKELSLLSGYSISTVSKALNNKLEISKATRETIKTIAKQHNYIPNNYAVSLRIQRTESIAVILPEVTKACYSQSLSQLQKSAESFGYRILFYQSFHSYTKELNYIKRLSDGSTDGIIVISTANQPKSHYFTSAVPVELLYIHSKHSTEEIEQISHKTVLNLLKI